MIKKDLILSLGCCLLPFCFGLHGQNNLIPEFTVDGTVKTFRETSTSGGPGEIVQRTFAERVGDAVETTLVQESVGGGSRVEFYIRVENGSLFDVGGRNESGGTVSKEIVEEPLADYALRPELDAQRSDTGIYRQEVSSGAMIVSEAKVEVFQQNKFVSGFEEVTVPAGTFPNAVRVEVFTEIETTASVPGVPNVSPTTSSITTTQWLANGVGLVKQVSTVDNNQGTQTSTRELLSYQVPGSVPTEPPEVQDSGSASVLPLWSDGTDGPDDPDERLGNFGTLSPTESPEWYESSFFGLSYIPDDPSKHDGFVWTERFGWMKFERSDGGEVYLYVPILKTWMEVRADGSFYSFDYRELVPTGIETYLSPVLGNVIVGESGGWVYSDRFGWVWAARGTDGTWFWSADRQDWLGVLTGNAVWSTNERRFL